MADAAMDELLQVLFYKMYTTPRRYVSNVRMIFQVKTMLGLDDDAFRRMCEDLDEGTLRAAIPEVMKRSLDGLEKELEKSEDSAALDAFMRRPAGAMTGAEKTALAILYLDAGVVARAAELLKQVIEADRSDGRAWMHLAECHLVASNLPAAESVCREGLAMPDLDAASRAALEERLLALRMKEADELYIREVFSLPYLDESDREFAAGRYAAAAAAAEHAFRITPGSYEALLRAGCAWMRQGETAKAERCFEQSLVIMEMPILVSNF